MASAQLVASHASKFPEEKILRQRHQVRVVPVTGLLEEQEAGVDPRQPAGRGRGAGSRARGRDDRAAGR